MLLKTKDYSIFKILGENRQINERNLNNIIQSMRIKNLLHIEPIKVNKDMGVIDGQHRLMAAQILGLEVVYTIESDLEVGDISLLNIQKDWSNEDYLQHFVRRGFSEYLKLNEFIKNSGVSFSDSLDLVKVRTRESSKSFKLGEYKFPPSDYIIDLMKDLDVLNRTVSIILRYRPELYKFLITRKFRRALKDLIQVPDFNLERFFTRLEKNIDKLRGCVSTESYAIMLVDIYNYGCHSGNRLSKEDLK